MTFWSRFRRGVPAKVHIAAPLHPMHRGDWFEDPLHRLLRRTYPGSRTTGAGTTLDAQHRPVSCDIGLKLVGDTDAIGAHLLEVLDALAPRGSWLAVDDRDPLPCGTLTMLIAHLAVPTPPDALYDHVPCTSEVMRLMVRMKSTLRDGEIGFIPTWWTEDAGSDIVVLGADPRAMREAIEAAFAVEPVAVGATIEVVTPAA